MSIGDGVTGKVSGIDKKAAPYPLPPEEPLGLLHAKYSRQRLKGDVAGKFETLATIANVRASQELAAADYRVDGRILAAMNRAAVLNKFYDHFLATRKAQPAMGAPSMWTRYISKWRQRSGPDI